MATRAEKLTISLPSNLIQVADEIAHEKKISRSKVVSSCLQELAEKLLQGRVAVLTVELGPRKDQVQVVEDAVDLGLETDPARRRAATGEHRFGGVEIEDDRDVGKGVQVDQRNALALARVLQRQVDGRGGLAHPSLSGSDGDRLSPHGLQSLGHSHKRRQCRRGGGQCQFWPFSPR